MAYLHPSAVRPLDIALLFENEVQVQTHLQHQSHRFDNPDIQFTHDLKIISLHLKELMNCQ